jgi:hypothetical protein
MKSHPLIRFALFLLLGVLWSPLAVLGESLFDYTSRCERELEIPQNSIKGFTCDVNSEILPTEQFGTACDSQPLLGNGCLGNSRMGVMTFSSNRDVMGPWICRKYRGFDTAGGGVYHDVALIIHNRKNGKTCFFQNNLDSTPIGVTPVVLGDGPIIPGPKDSNAHSVWRDPQGVVAAAICTSCHTNDPDTVGESTSKF